MHSTNDAQSNPKTPLTIRWTKEARVDVENRRAERGLKRRRLATLAGGFVTGIGLGSLSAWALGQTHWLGDALLGGIAGGLAWHRWAAKRFGWNKVDASEPEPNLTAADIKRRRRVFSIFGLLIGVLVAGLIGWLQSDPVWFLHLFWGCLTGYEIGISFGEQFHNVPTLDDLGMVRMREEMSPLDLKRADSVPVTLNRPKKTSAKL